MRGGKKRRQMLRYDSVISIANVCKMTRIENASDGEINIHVIPIKVSIKLRSKKRWPVLSSQAWGERGGGRWSDSGRGRLHHVAFDECRPASVVFALFCGLLVFADVVRDVELFCCPDSSSSISFP